MIKSENELYNDTRSLIYINVFTDLISNNQVVFGKGASGKYNTHFYGQGGTIDGYRFRSEVDFLNRVLYGGIIGFMLFLIVNFKVFFRKIAGKKYILQYLIVATFFISFIENTSELSILWVLYWLIISHIVNDN